MYDRTHEEQAAYYSQIGRTFTALDRATFTLATDRPGNESQPLARWLVFWSIHNRSKDHGPIRASVARLVDWLAASTRTVRDALADLVAVGLIEARRTGRRITDPMAYAANLDRLARLQKLATAKLSTGRKTAPTKASASAKSQTAKSQTIRGMKSMPQPCKAPRVVFVDNPPTPTPNQPDPDDLAPICDALRHHGMEPTAWHAWRKLDTQHGTRAVLAVLAYACEQARAKGKGDAYAAGIARNAIADGLHQCRHQTPDQTAQALAEREAREAAPRTPGLALAALSMVKAALGIRPENRTSKGKGDANMVSPSF